MSGYEVVVWDGIVVPAGTPNEIVSRLHGELVKALKRPDVKERLDAAGLEPVGTTPEQFASAYSQ
jgi:tripartite-type tricarboxylate transporter receptor subunit TctC